MIYLFVDQRDPVYAWYGTAMLISLQGQDDRPCNPIAKILIGLLSIVSGLIYAVFIWTYTEHLFWKNFKVKVLVTCTTGILVGLITFLVYFYVEGRNRVDAIYGSLVLLSLLGQDDAPETDLGMILIGILSLVSNFLFGVLAWSVIEDLVFRKFHSETLSHSRDVATCLPD